LLFGVHEIQSTAGRIDVPLGHTIICTTSHSANNSWLIHDLLYRVSNRDVS
jgi:hypothetical protein